MDIIDRLLPRGRHNRPGTVHDKTSITIHETGNTGRGADALAHASYLERTSDKVSWHYTVDDRRIVQHLPEDEIAWHSGTAAGNTTSISLEVCVNADGDFGRACENAAELVRSILARRGWGVSAIKQHHDWNGKNCPERLRRSGWAEFIEMCKGGTSMAYTRKIRAADIARIKPVMGLNNRPEPIGNVQARTGAHIVLNGGTYLMQAPWTVDSGLTIDGQVYSERYTGFGFALNGSRYAWSYKNSQKWPDFVGAYSTLLRNGARDISLPINTRDGRTAIGITDAGELVLYVVGKSDPAACTTAELSDRMAALGCVHAINLDGSHSSKINAPDGRVTSSRDVLWYICIWLTPGAEKTPEPEEYAAVATARMGTLNASGQTELFRWIDEGDVCRIRRVTPNLLIEVDYPSGSTRRTAYVRSLQHFKRV